MPSPFLGNVRLAGIGGGAPAPAPEPIEVTVEDDAVPTDINGAVVVETPDGGVVVELNPRSKGDDGDFDANLADRIDASALAGIASTLVQAIEDDDASRQGWMQQRSRGLELLGLKIEEARGDIGGSSAPLEGMSTVRHPLMLEAVLRFAANARAELLPAAGPVKVRNDGDETEARNTLADALEKDFNHYLTSIAKEYYPDTNRMLFWVGYGGCGFKKLYHCPIRRRPVSESVDAKDMIVSDAATTVENAERMTHVITMSAQRMKRMQIVGAYLDVPLLQSPSSTPDAVTQKEAEIQGVAAEPQRIEDRKYTIYECYTDLDLPGFEDADESGEPTGLALPYRITIEKDSQTVLEIRRMWREGDDLKMPRRCFVRYPFVDAMGFYALGLLHILGNTTSALTAAWREFLDAGMFANFPGFLYAKEALGRQLTNEFRVAPGSGLGIQTGGAPISQAVMPLPYKEPGPASQAFVTHVEEVGQRVGGTPELSVGEGRQDAPVGTTIALLEQATQTMAAVHKGLHTAQAEEFAILRELFLEDPEALVRGNRRPKLKVDQIMAALEDVDLVPAADPNTPSAMHRIMKAQALKQLQGMNPDLYDAKNVESYVLSVLNIDDPSLLAPPAAPAGPPPELQAKMAEIQLKNKKIDTDAALKDKELKMKAADIAFDNSQQEKDRELQRQIAATREETARVQLSAAVARHPTSVDEAAVFTPPERTTP